MKHNHESHSFNVPVAIAIGIDKALILREIHNALGWKIAQNKLQGGLPWFYLAAKAAADKMPYFSAKSVARWLAELEAAGILFAARLSPKGYDQTKFYTMNFEAWQCLLSAQQPDKEQCNAWKSGVAKIAAQLMADRVAAAELEEQLHDDVVSYRNSKPHNSPISQNENCISQNGNDEKCTKKTIAQNENTIAQNENTISQNEQWIAQNEQPITTQETTQSIVFLQKTKKQQPTQKIDIGCHEIEPSSKRKKVAPKKESGTTWAELSNMPSATPITLEQANIVIAHNSTGSQVGDQVLSKSIAHRFHLLDEQPNATSKKGYRVTISVVTVMRNVIAKYIQLGANPSHMLAFTMHHIEMGTTWKALWASGNDAFERWVKANKSKQQQNGNEDGNGIFKQSLRKF